MPTEIWSAIIQVVTPVLLAVGGFYFGRRQQFLDRNRQKVLETNHSSAALVNPQRLGPIAVSVDKSLITGQNADKGTYEVVKSAYSYVIEAANVGLEHLESPEININLGNDAVIVETKVLSETIPPDKLTNIEAPDKNFRRFKPAYINRNESITISILSVNDTNPGCEIKVGGIGITLQDRATIVERERRWAPYWEATQAIGNLVVFFTSRIWRLRLGQCFAAR